MTQWEKAQAGYLYDANYEPELIAMRNTCAAQLDIAMINKYYDLASMQPEVPATVKSHYEGLSHHASECIGCQECEARCPFEVPIAHRMGKASELFGF